MPGRGRAAHAALAAAVVLLLGLPRDASTQSREAADPPPVRVSAQDSSSAGSRPSPQFSASLQWLTGIHDIGFDIPGHERPTGLHAQVYRLRWRFTPGGGVTLSLHNRLQARISAAPTTRVLARAGLGVSVVPPRLMDLSIQMLDKEPLELWHDVDRLALTVRATGSDVTLGRQPISWGLAYLFPVSDMWARFSPFELDTEEKMGVDAIRVLAYPASGLELDAVLAGGKHSGDWATGLHATLELSSADAYAAVGRFWNQAMALGGVTYMLGHATLRAEVGVPWNVGERAAERPRATLGADWIGSELRLTGEYHYSGLGVANPGDYLAQLEDARVRRGETYFLGRHYLGGAFAYNADEGARTSISLGALWNLGDRSAAVTPMLSHEFTQSSSASVGALYSLGAVPTLAPMALRSEFGSYGSLGFARLSIFF